MSETPEERAVSETPDERRERLDRVRVLAAIPTMPEFITVRQIAERLGLSLSSVNRALRDPAIALDVLVIPGRQGRIFSRYPKGSLL